jgi:TPR repeat protein
LQLTLRAGTRGGGRDAKRAFRIACESKQRGGCSRLAKLLYNGEGGEGSDPQQALDVYLSSCDGGEPKDCVTAGSILLAGDRTRRDPAQARELFKLACEKGDGEGCGEFGKVLMQGTDGTKDENKAVAYFQQGCDKNDGASCVAYAHVLAEGRIFQKKDTAGALALYAKGCELGFAPGCAEQAEFLRQGIGTVQDNERAVKLYREACNKQVALGCFGLAHYELDGGPGIVKNPMHSEDQLVGFCKKDHLGVACLDLGQAYQKGTALKASRERAQEYLALACKEGIKEACGEPIPITIPPAPLCPNRDRLNDRCEEGDGEACVRLGQMYEKGRCAPKNVCEGHRQYKVGCVIHKHEQSCVLHAQFHKQSYGNQCGG